MKNYSTVLLLLFLALVGLCIPARINNRGFAQHPIASLRDSRKHWCKSIAFRQTVKRENCKDRKIINKMCSGECLSYYFAGGDYSKVVFFVCHPSQQETKVVLLDCLEDGRRKFQKVFVQITKECSCMLVDLKRSNMKIDHFD